MTQRPEHLTVKNASRFKDKGLVDVYHHRLPYPQETFQMLLNLIQDEPRNVLDVGTGIGNLARNLAPHVDHVDAIDFSAEMLKRAKTLSNGDASNLNWILGRVEDSIPDRKYSLIVGADSMHWMDWDVIFPTFAEHLTPNGYVAIVGRIEKHREWQDDLLQLIKKYSLYQNFRSYSLIQIIQDKNLFKLVDDQYTEYITSHQSVDDYIASWHSRGSLSPTEMGSANVAEYDAAVRELVEPYAVDGKLELQTRARITWGRPLTGRLTI